MSSKSDEWAPICGACKTQTIVVVGDSLVCSTCNAEWDGSERDDSIYSEAAKSDVMFILAYLWKRGCIEDRA